MFLVIFGTPNIRHLVTDVRPSVADFGIRVLPRAHAFQRHKEFIKNDIKGSHATRSGTGFLGGSFCPVFSYGLHYVGHYSAMCNERGILGKSHPRRPRGSQSGREKRRDESFYYGRKSPWVPTLNGPFPKIQADAGS